MMKKKSASSSMAIILLLTCAHNSYSFSLRDLGSSFVTTMITRSARLLGLWYIENYLESHGYDSDNRRQEARRSGTCHIPWPSDVKGEVPIVPETVPSIVRERIEALKENNYTWPTCKPLLLTGLAGVGKTQLGRYLAKQSQCKFMYVSAAGFMSSKENSGVETVAALFKRSRIRSEFETWALRFRQLFAFVCRRPIPRKKPTIDLLMNLMQ